MTKSKDTATKAPEPVTFIPAIDFLGYPDGKTRIDFKAGKESPPVPADYAALMRKKGLVADKKTTAQASGD